MTIESPARLRQKLYQYWQDNLPDWEPGFQVFYSPIEQQPILFVGINPGGDAGDFEGDRRRFENGKFSITRTCHDYLSDDPPEIGRKTRPVLGDEIIANSVKTNINFFRSEDTKTFEKEVSNASQHKKQCRDWVWDIIEYVDPDVIIAEATAGAYDPLKDHVLNDVTEVSVDKPQGYRITCVAITPDRTIVGYPLPTGQNQYFDANTDGIRTVVHEVIADNTALDL